MEAMKLLAEGFMFGEQEGFKVDLTKGALWLVKATQLGSIWATETLGLLLLEGSRCRQDIKRGMNLLRVAAKQGSYLSKYELGCILSQGDYDVDIDNREARKWFLKLLLGPEPWISPFIYHDTQKRLGELRKTGLN